MSLPEKAKAPTVGAVEAPEETHSKKQRQFSAKSTASEAQRQRIVEALRRRPQTSYDLRRIGCYQCAARVKELRDRFGFGIETHRVTLVDRDGYSHPRAALYCLVAEPGETQP